MNQATSLCIGVEDRELEYEDCLIGAGAVVIKDVPDRAVMAGVPAKVLRVKEE